MTCIYYIMLILSDKNTKKSENGFDFLNKNKKFDK